MKNIANEVAAGRTDFEEDVFPSVAKTIGSDNLMHILWQSDDQPGMHVQGDLDPARKMSVGEQTWESVKKDR